MCYLKAIGVSTRRVAFTSSTSTLAEPSLTKGIRIEPNERNQKSHRRPASKKGGTEMKSKEHPRGCDHCGVSRYLGGMAFAAQDRSTLKVPDGLSFF